MLQANYAVFLQQLDIEIIKRICLLICEATALVLCMYYSFNDDNGFEISEPNWKSAHIDCTCVGCYDETLQTTAFYYFKQIMASGYRQDKLLSTISTLEVWYEEHAIDPDLYIKSAMTIAEDEVVKAVAECEKTGGSEPHFSISKKYDWHQLPNKILHNDHFPYAPLIRELNTVFGIDIPPMYGKQILDMEVS